MRCWQMKAGWVLVIAMVASSPAVAEEMVLDDAAAAAVANAPGAQNVTAAVPAAEPALTATPAAQVISDADAPKKKVLPDGMGLTMALHFANGGDDLVYVAYTDGSIDTISAGEGFGFSVGGHFRPQDSRVDFSAVAGLKMAQISSENGSIEVRRTLLEFRADYYLTDSVWAGLGRVMHTGIKADLDGFGQSFTLDDADGLVFKLGWQWFALAHTKIEYVDDTGITYDASSTGIEFIGRF